MSALELDGSRLTRVASLIGERGVAGFDLMTSADGGLARRDRSIAFAFAFRFRDRLFAANAETEGDQLKLAFFAEFGVLPFSHEDRARRAQILAFLPLLGEAGLTWEIPRNQAIRIGANLRLDGTTAPREILAAVIERLMMSRAALDAMAELAYVPVKPSPGASRPVKS